MANHGISHRSRAPAHQKKYKKYNSQEHNGNALSFNIIVFYVSDNQTN